MASEDLASPPPGVTMRMARPEDHTAIVAIGEVYQGLDYLDFMYPHYMKNPNIICYVLFVHTKLVTFVVRYAVDDGETVVSVAARTHPSSQGQRYVKYLQFFADEHFQKYLPKPASRLVYASYETDALMKMIKRNSKISAVLTRRQLYSTKSTKRNITDIVSAPAFQRRSFHERLWSPDKATFIPLITSPQNKQRLFPDNQLMIFWIPYRPTKSNFEYILERSVVFVSGYTKTYSAISFITLIPCKNGLRVDLDLFGTDNDSIVQHIYNCLEYLAKLNVNLDMVIELILYLPLCIEISPIKRLMSTWGFSAGSWAQYAHSVLVQQEMPQYPAKL